MNENKKIWEGVKKEDLLVFQTPSYQLKTIDPTKIKQNLDVMSSLTAKIAEGLLQAQDAAIAKFVLDDKERYLYMLFYHSRQLGSEPKQPNTYTGKLYLKLSNTKISKKDWKLLFGDASNTLIEIDRNKLDDNAKELVEAYLKKPEEDKDQLGEKK